MQPGNPTYIMTILDRSGSMSTIAADAEGGFNAFVRQQRELPGACYLSLVRFDTEYTEDYVNRPLAEVPELQLHPRGMTALYDAVGRGVTTLAERLAALPPDQAPGAVIVVIVTDGEENSSREWTGDRVRALVEAKTAEGWVFQYLAADASAFDAARTLGVRHANTAQFSAARSGQTYGVVSQSVARARHAGFSGQSAGAAAAYTEAEREAMTGE